MVYRGAQKGTRFSDEASSLFRVFIQEVSRGFCGFYPRLSTLSGLKVVSQKVFSILQIVPWQHKDKKITLGNLYSLFLWLSNIFLCSSKDHQGMPTLWSDSRPNSKEGRVSHPFSGVFP